MAAKNLSSPGADEPQAVGVIVLATDDTFMHLYADFAGLRADPDVSPHSGLEFFDSDGYRLAPRFRAGWKFDGLVRIADDAEDPKRVQDRICRVLANVRAYLEDPEHTSAYLDFGMDRAEALADVPDLAGLSLAESLAILGVSPTDADERPVRHGIGSHNEGFLHTAWHLAGGQH